MGIVYLLLVHSKCWELNYIAHLCAHSPSEFLEGIDFGFLFPIASDILLDSQ